MTNREIKNCCLGLYCIWNRSTHWIPDINWKCFATTRVDPPLSHEHSSLQALHSIFNLSALAPVSKNFHYYIFLWPNILKCLRSHLLDLFFYGIFKINLVDSIKPAWQFIILTLRDWFFKKKLSKTKLF